MNGYAFFDVDGTLLRLTSMKDFQIFVEHAGGFPRRTGLHFTRALLHYGAGRLPREFLNALYYRQYAGCNVADLTKLGAAWFQTLMQGSPSIWNAGAYDRLIWHRQQQHQVVLVSGSFSPCLDPIARHLEVTNILCARLDVKDGCYTGRVMPPQTIGRGKATVMASFLARQPNHDPKQVWAYGDHHSDIPMLELAAEPIALAGDPRLEAYAKRQGWAII